nr:aminoacyl-histidine dipeptidase [uncultured Mediterraneibacter sp.]
MKLEACYPEKVFYYFEEISRIPRGSGNVTEISNYCVEFAKQRNLWVEQDPWKNVWIKKPGSGGCENCEPVMIQGHLDMVCEKTAESLHDFEKDPLELYVEDGFVKAKDTTLGADDGIAVAYALAILDSDDLVHPPLHVILTTDEETGMDGAIGFDFARVDGRKMLNLDSEDEGIITVGCAGGATVQMSLDISREEKHGTGLTLFLTGLKGGHSGVEIINQPGNADKLMGRFLNGLQRKQMLFDLVDLKGGQKNNVIPGTCEAKLLVDPESAGRIIGEWNVYEKTLKKEFGASEPNLKLTYEKQEDSREKVLAQRAKEAVIFYLNNCPNGVYEYSRTLEQMVETSCNLGIVNTTEDAVLFETLIRSSFASKVEEMKERFVQWEDLIPGMHAKISGEYPSWEYQPDSELQKTVRNCYHTLYGKDPQFLTIHAGLECGIFAGKKEEFDCVSFGPQIYDIHSVKERLDIESTGRTWKLILKILEALTV